MIPILISIIVICVGILIYRWYEKGRDLPPGPPTIPFIGCGPWLGKKRLYEYAVQLDEENGNPGLICFRVMNVNIVMVNNIQLVRELFINQSSITSNRPRGIMNKHLNEHSLGIVSAAPHRWEYSRRFSLRVLKDFGLGKSKVIDGLISDQMTLLEKRFEESNEKPFDPTRLLSRAVGGIISKLLFDQLSQEEDEKFDIYLKDVSDFLSCSFRWLLFFPFLRHFYHKPLIHSYIPHHEVMDSFDRVMEFIAAKIKEHHVNVSEKSDVSNFIDAYLTYKDSPRTVSSDPVVQEHSDEHLRIMLFELLVAGADTTTLTLRWALLFLGHHIDIQECMFREIESHVGCEAKINFSHASQLHYARAVVNEILRFGNVAGISLPHSASEDIKVGKYVIPKDSRLFINITAIMRHNASWKNAVQFDPNNFLDDNGHFISNDNFIGFSTGKRVCLGESLARNESFVFICSMIQKFKVSLCLQKGETYESIMEGSFIGGLRLPKAFEIVVERRN